ncbi:hypothetical protein PR048_009259 [Dryococelus australis]|uniref:Integrase catalytic domain-containing protein n=1 Tax=Dryococelus australis TaxID=614101 RepID=A0ABQ9HZD6_9NEOP|nr:hypothetical protein PR048_009259 [Dryococelus australis]
MTIPITWRGNTITVDVYVVQGLNEPLLGRSAIESLGILQWVEEVNQLCNKFDPRESYAKLFEGLGLMAATYTIRLKNDAVPVSLHAPRRVVVPLQPKLKPEIDRLVNMGIVSPVGRPTEWCSGIVIVSKLNGQIRLCVDLQLSTQLSKQSIQSYQLLMIHLHSYDRLKEDGTEHYENLDKVRKLEAAGINLNYKCAFGTDLVKFLGHVISSEGVKADLTRIEAIRDMSQPQSVTNVRRLLEMVNYIGKFVPNLMEITEPIRHQLKECNAFLWEEPQELPPSSNFITTQIRTCEWSRGLPIRNRGSIGAVGCRGGMETSYICIAITLCIREKHSQIEKEALALTWTCDRFYMYILAKDLLLITDHQPLVFIFGNKNIDELPPGFQSWNTSGKHFYTPDALSREPVKGTDESDRLAIDEIEEYAAQFMRHFPASDVRIEEVRRAQNLDATCRERDGLGDPHRFHHHVRHIDRTEEELSVVEGILMKGVNMLIPARLQNIMDCIHLVHLGNNKCTERARAKVWWPEPLLPSPLPQVPWEVVGIDLAERDGTHYLVVIDYYSQYPDIFQLPETETSTAISRKYGFSHVTSSPRYAQSNGQVEAAIKKVKNIIKRSAHPYLELLSYRSTSFSDLEYSIAQLLMSLSLWDTLPTTYQNLQPKVVDKNKFTVIHDEAKSRQKAHFDQRHRTRERFPLQPSQRVWVTDLQSVGKIIFEVARLEPLLPSPLPQVPWEVVGMDLAERDGTHYLVVIDYYSRYPEIFQLPETKTSTTISRSKTAFSRQGISREVRFDNGPQSYPLESENPTVRTMPRENIAVTQEEDDEDWAQLRSLSLEMFERQRREEDEECKGWPNLPAAQDKGRLTTPARKRGGGCKTSVLLKGREDVLHEVSCVNGGWRDWSGRDKGGSQQTEESLRKLGRTRILFIWRARCICRYWKLDFYLYENFSDQQFFWVWRVA